MTALHISPETVIRGFATTKIQLADILGYGVPDRAAYLVGRRGESLDGCLDSFRGRRGRLIIAHDLRVLGETKRAVAAGMAKLENAGIIVTDIVHPGDTTVSQLVQRANVAIAGARFRDKRTVKRMGRRGGLGKGISAHLAREAASPKWLIDRIVDARDITWKRKAELLAPHFSESTLRRHYGSFPYGKTGGR